MKPKYDPATDTFSREGAEALAYDAVATGQETVITGISSWLRSLAEESGDTVSISVILSGICELSELPPAIPDGSIQLLVSNFIDHEADRLLEEAAIRKHGVN